jgi:hypothetical protein
MSLSWKDRRIRIAVGAVALTWGTWSVADTVLRPPGWTLGMQHLQEFDTVAMWIFDPGLEPVKGYGFADADSGRVVVNLGNSEIFVFEDNTMKRVLCSSPAPPIVTTSPLPILDDLWSEVRSGFDGSIVTYGSHGGTIRLPFVWAQWFTIQLQMAMLVPDYNGLVNHPEFAGGWFRVGGEKQRQFNINRVEWNRELPPQFYSENMKDLCDAPLRSYAQMGPDHPPWSMTIQHQ